MPTDDLSSIPGLEDKHLRALARQQVTDLRGLADADQHGIHKTMANMRPRPGLEQISGWQEEARSRLAEAEADAAGWRRVASFAVIFARRQEDDTWKPYVEVERTEVEPEQDRQIWAGWDFESVGNWMADQLRAADSESTPAQPVAAQPEAAEPEGATAQGRSQLHIESAAVTDANGTVDLVTRGVLAAGLPPELTAPVRVVLTVGGARPGTALQAVTRILRPDGPGWNPQHPVAIPGSGQAEFDLADVPPGQYEMALIAWAPDVTAKPVSVRLPALTIRPGSG